MYYLRKNFSGLKYINKFCYTFQLEIQNLFHTQTLFEGTKIKIMIYFWSMAHGV